MHTNSVLALRDRQLLNVRRPFIARGSSLSRCKHCMLAKHHCICLERPDVTSQSAFCLIYYQGEVFKPSNTGRLIADIVSDNYAYQWARTSIDPEFEALLANPDYVPILVFPHEYAQDAQKISSVAELEAEPTKRKPLFILLDGTWREAKKMFRSAYFQNLPVLGLKPDSPSRYHLREAAHLHQLCTAEVAMEVLYLQKEHEAAEALKTYFSLFRNRYLAGKANLRAGIHLDPSVLENR